MKNISLSNNNGYIGPKHLQHLPSELDGSAGLYRNKDVSLSLVAANTDMDAIEEWLSSRGAKSASTMRSYRKEAERLLAWAIVEHNKPVSSLNISDMVEYEVFLKNPTSQHAGISWIAKKYVCPKTQKESTKRYRRSDPEWRPFDAPLLRSSIEHAMTVLKSLFSFWTDVGYTVVNPLKVRKKAFIHQKKSVKQRVLSPATWEFLRTYLVDAHEESLQSVVTNTAQKRLVRVTSRRLIVFTVLYLLGVRISELASIKMSDIKFHYTSEGYEKYWIDIIGKGNKLRTIPVPDEIITLIASYRDNLNKHAMNYKKHDKTKAQTLLLHPTLQDDSYLILSMSGTAGLTSNSIHNIVKETLADAVCYFELDENKDRYKKVSKDQLASASTHWMRHTSATHQHLQGVDDLYIQQNLGHSSRDTTSIYTHTEEEQWLKETGKFSTGGGPSKV
jgi:integrase/recombinase XerD